MARNNLTKAREAKKDEFYTQLSDIEKNSVTTQSTFVTKWSFVIAMTLTKVIFSNISL